MTKPKDPLVEALEEGRSYTFTISDGGNLASMRAALKHGQTITISPVIDWHAIKAGDIVFVKWRGGNHILHLVGEVQGDQFLITNSLGKVNGWVHGQEILGVVTEIVEPEPRPEVPQMLDQLQSAYQALTARAEFDQEDILRLLSISEDLRWYAARLGPERWEQLPRLNQWSFTQNLWHLLRQAKEAAVSEAPISIETLIHHGKQHVGYVAETLILFEQMDATP
ncbi:MAG: hypothetical protein AB1894_01895 [Chloroflexota bacterium]